MLIITPSSLLNKNCPYLSGGSDVLVFCSLCVVLLSIILLLKLFVALVNYLTDAIGKKITF